MSAMPVVSRILLFVLALSAIGVEAQQKKKKITQFWERPEFTGRHVYDDAGMLKAETIANLEEILNNVEDSTGNQVAVLTFFDLSGVMETYARKTIEEWKLGGKKQNGVLLLIVQDRREVRIQVGEGVIGRLTPEICQRIIDNEIIPHFKDKEYDDGTSAAVQGIVAGLSGNYDPPKAGSGYRIFFIGLAVLVILVSCFGLFSKSWFIAAYAGLLPFHAVIVGPFISWWVVGGIVAGFPLIRFLLVKSKVKLLTFGSNATGGLRSEDLYDKMQRRNDRFDSSDSGSSSGSSSSDRSGGSGRW